MELRKLSKTNVPGSFLYQKHRVNVDQNVPLIIWMWRGRKTIRPTRKIHRKPILQNIGLSIQARLSKLDLFYLSLLSKSRYQYSCFEFIKALTQLMVRGTMKTFSLSTRKNWKSWVKTAKQLSLAQKKLFGFELLKLMKNGLWGLNIRYCFRAPLKKD